MSESTAILVDTDVLIWYLRGHEKARKALDDLETFSISAVTYMEILHGMRNKKELRLWKLFLKSRNIRNLLIDEAISSKALFWTEEFCLSHRLRLADALIAATADAHGLNLLTGNAADYQFLPGLGIKQFRVH